MSVSNVAVGGFPPFFFPPCLFAPFFFPPFLFAPFFFPPFLFAPRVCAGACAHDFFFVYGASPQLLCYFIHVIEQFPIKLSLPLSLLSLSLNIYAATLLLLCYLIYYTYFS